ncbi:MAG: phosphoglucosamine mutase [Bacteroidetes bacterium OLB9]|nr:MAG: phosphoglucosamine mutase [Bacteroidetes bacterium OLB9]
MTLIKSISGIRGTIGGQSGENLTPVDIVECTAAFGTWLIRKKVPHKVVVGRDGRLSGSIVSQLSINTLLAMGIDVIDLGLSTTPTVEMAVPRHNAGAGIIFTASHNPREWNALKFLNEQGDFISPEDGQTIVELVQSANFDFAPIHQLGKYSKYDHAIDDHLVEILKSDYADVASVQHAGIKVVVDCINSTGALSVPPLLNALNVEYTLINNDDFGNFAHNPEPLPAHLAMLSEKVKELGADLGISVDPDVDRLAFVCEDGSMFGEEYTLVAVADYILSRKPGNTVSNLSSTRALADITKRYSGQYSAAAVGEVNVVNEMKRVNAVIGGEGNGGVIVPDLHYGRDALAGIAIFLSLIAEKRMTATALRATYPHYEIIKDKISLTPELNLDEILSRIKVAFASEKLNEIDGLKIDFENGWVHMRKSNTEPIVRIYAEAASQEVAQNLIDKVKAII